MRSFREPCTERKWPKKITSSIGTGRMGLPCGAAPLWGQLTPPASGILGAAYESRTPPDSLRFYKLYMSEI